MMAAPSTCCLTFVCENEILKDGIAFVCGRWEVVTRGEELPFCHKCKRPLRTWRLVTQREIEARDDAFLRAIERLSYLRPNDHLGATERQ